ncbi:MAG TPA: type IV secretion system protein [Chloroflexia bacterium]|nr:type IV secretion system protein [Chloroflexia bacterium]
MQNKIYLIFKKNTLLAGKVKLLPLLVLLPLLLGGCSYTDYSNYNNTPVTPGNLTSIDNNDWGILNILRDAIINLVTGLASLVGNIAISILSWLLDSARAVRFDYPTNLNGVNLRTCTPDTQLISIEPLARCGAFVFDDLVTGVFGMLVCLSFFLFLAKYMLQGLFPQFQSSMFSFFVKAVGVTLLVLNLDWLLTMVLDISTQVFLFILGTDNTKLDKLQPLFNIGPDLHKNNVAFAILLSLLAIVVAIPLLLTGLFFLIRALTLIFWFVVSPLAVASLMTDETAPFFSQWKNRFIGMAVAPLPIAVVMRIGVVLQQNFKDFAANPLQLIIMMLAVALLFCISIYMGWNLFMSEMRRNVGTARAGFRLAGRAISGTGAAFGKARNAPGAVGGKLASGYNAAGEALFGSTEVTPAGARSTSGMLGRFMPGVGPWRYQERSSAAAQPSASASREQASAPMGDVAASIDRLSREMNALFSAMQSMTINSRQASSIPQNFGPGFGAQPYGWPDPTRAGATGAFSFGTGGYDGSGFGAVPLSPASNSAASLPALEAGRNLGSELTGLAAGQRQLAEGQEKLPDLIGQRLTHQLSVKPQAAGTGAGAGAGAGTISSWPGSPGSNRSVGGNGHQDDLPVLIQPNIEAISGGISPFYGSGPGPGAGAGVTLNSGYGFAGDYLAPGAISAGYTPGSNPRATVPLSGLQAARRGLSYNARLGAWVYPDGSPASQVTTPQPRNSGQLINPNTGRPITYQVAGSAVPTFEMPAPAAVPAAPVQMQPAPGGVSGEGLAAVPAPVINDAAAVSVAAPAMAQAAHPIAPLPRRTRLNSPAEALANVNESQGAGPLTNEERNSGSSSGNNNGSIPASSVPPPQVIAPAAPIMPVAAAAPAPVQAGAVSVPPPSRRIMPPPLTPHVRAVPAPPQPPVVEPPGPGEPGPAGKD